MASLVQLSSFPSVSQTRPLHRHRHRRQPVRCSDDRRALFSRIAPVYDNLNDLLSLGQHRIWKRMAVSWSGSLVLISPRSNYRLLQPDSTCAPKLVTRILSEHWWVEGDALDLPFPDCYADAITIGYGLRNVVDQHKAMKEMHRVLKPGAKLSILDFNKSTEPFSASIQGWMIDNVVVPVANSYGVAEEYKYLKRSIDKYLTGKELEDLALEAGFSTAKHFEVGGGLMGNLVATR